MSRHYEVDFKIDLPFIGPLRVERFRRTRAECEAIQKTGQIRWGGYIWPINRSRSEISGSEAPATLTEQLTPRVSGYAIFVTETSQPIRRQTFAERAGKTSNGFAFCGDCRCWYPAGEPDEHKHTSSDEMRKLIAEVTDHPTGGASYCG